MAFETKGRSIVAGTVIVFMITVISWGQRPIPLDPNEVPFGIDPNFYTADLLQWVVADPNVSIISTIQAHNKGGWATELSVVMADGTPTDAVVQKLTTKPVQDPNGGWNQGFQWGWTPRSEGVFYLELRLTTKGKPLWKGDRRTVVVYAFGEDIPYLVVQDVPILRLTQAQRLWQYSMKAGRPLTKPTKVVR